jgi:hypothetical protein
MQAAKLAARTRPLESGSAQQAADRNCGFFAQAVVDLLAKLLHLLAELGERFVIADGVAEALTYSTLCKCCQSSS